MKAVYTRSVDDALERAVLARFGAGASVDVVRYLDRELNGSERVPWYVLSIKRGRLDDWQIVGRRRTRSELIRLIETCPL